MNAKNIALTQEISACQRLFPNLNHEKIKQILTEKREHGQFSTWFNDIQNLEMQITHADFPKVAGIIDKEALFNLLEALKPWRKGQFDLFGIDLDSEWRSVLKYQRLQEINLPIKDLDILDVGCGNGYYLFRLLQDGARAVLGIDPSWHYFAQYLLLNRCFSTQKSAFLPCTLDDYDFPQAFDLTLSMGVFYHRREPLTHLLQLRNTLKNKGFLLLETLIIDGDDQQLLLPEDSYAGMPNVYFLPSVPLLCRFLERSGFEIVRLGKIYPTTTNEQRKTPWLDSYSLDKFLNPAQNQTCEGLAPPKRIMILAQRKN